MITKSLLAKISKVRAQVQIVKSAEADAKKFTYMYAKLQDNVLLVDPVIAELGLWYNWTIADDNLTISVYDLETGEFVSSSLKLDDDHQKFQEIGKQITYYSNRLLLLIFGLVAQDDLPNISDDDDDGNSSKHASTKSSRGSSKRSRRPVVVEEDEPEEDEEDDDGDEEVLPRRTSTRHKGRAYR